MVVGRMVHEHTPELLGHEKPESKEKGLLRKLLYESLTDVKRRRGERAAEAEAWIFGTPFGRKRWSFGDFESVCHVLGLDPAAVREQLAREMRAKRGIA